MKWWQDTQSLLLVIAAVAAALKVVIDSVYTGKKLTAIEKKQETNQALNTIKLDSIHNATNGGLEMIKAQLTEATRKISELEAQLRKRITSTASIVMLMLLIPTNSNAQATKLDPDLAWSSNQNVANIISYGTVVTSISIDLYSAFTSDDKKKEVTKVGIKDGSIIGISELTKLLVHRTRPDGSDRKSFYSEHTALSFSCFGKCIYFGFTTGYLRTAANRHYLTDVIVGGLVGSGINATVNKVMK